MNVPKARKLPSGSWTIQMRLGGRSVSVTRFSERACILEAERIKAAYRATGSLTEGKEVKGAKSEQQGPTVADAIQHYIDSRRNVLSPSTLRAYTTMAQNRWKSINQRVLRDIQPSEWQGIVDAEARTCGAKTLKNAWFLLSAAITHATQKKPPRVQLAQVVPAERPFLSAEQIRIFMQAIHGADIELPALLALSSLRLSEISALRWEDIPPKPDFIRVSGAVVPNEHHKLERKATNKNAASTRNVPIFMPELREAIERERKAEGPVLAMSQREFRDKVNRLCAANGLPQVGVHGLRHSFASLAYHLQIPEQITMQIGGWADAGTMRKIYTHIAQADIDHYSGAMSRFYKNANKNANDGAKARE